VARGSGHIGFEEDVINFAYGKEGNDASYRGSEEGFFFKVGKGVLWRERSDG
jgi:hypothetical protein